MRVVCCKKNNRLNLNIIHGAIIRCRLRILFDPQQTTHYGQHTLSVYAQSKRRYSHATMAAAGIDDSSNRGGQFYYWLNLASTFRLRFAELYWRGDRRSDGFTRVGIFKADRSAAETVTDLSDCCYQIDADPVTSNRVPRSASIILGCLPK